MNNIIKHVEDRMLDDANRKMAALYDTINFANGDGNLCVAVELADIYYDLFKEDLGIKQKYLRTGTYAYDEYITDAKISVKNLLFSFGYYDGYQALEVIDTQLKYAIKELDSFERDIEYDA